MEINRILTFNYNRKTNTSALILDTSALKTLPESAFIKNKVTVEQVEETKEKEMASKLVGKSSNKKETALKRLPKAIIIGVKKSGTATLHIVLNLHPNVVVSDHNTYFFFNLKNFNRGLKYYKSLMPKSYQDQVSIF